mgnify:CR=1 FL=1
MAFLASAIDDDGGSPVPEPAASRTRWLITSLFFTFGMVISMNDVLIPKLKESLPARRMGTEAEVSAAICFLLSPAAAAITGQDIAVCGGSSVLK